MNQKNVTWAKPKIGGAVFVAPVGTTMPTDAVSNLDEAFQNLGYLSDDGISNENTPETEFIKAWGGDTVLAQQTDKKDIFKLTLIEGLSTAVLKLIYGDNNVSGNVKDGLSIDATNKEFEPKSFVFEMIFKNSTIKRIVIPEAVITEIGEIKYGDEDAVGYEVSILAYPNADGSTHKEFIKGKSE